MKPLDQDKVLGSNPRLGVVRITCAPVQGSYDHKRHHAAVELGHSYDDGAPVLVWDFFLTRADGTSVRFHTNWKNHHVEVADLQNPPVLPGPPEHGRGKSDGKGTYRRKKAGNYTPHGCFPRGTPGGGGAADKAQGNVGGTGGADAAPQTHGGGGGGDAAPNTWKGSGWDSWKGGGGGGDAAQASHGGGGGGAAPQANHGGGGGDDSTWKGWGWDSWNAWHGWQSLSWWW